tara:strand:- start:1280 stop:1405 length:126 start_codon:yes stop_codon:yes gene_type:complete
MSGFYTVADICRVLVLEGMNWIAPTGKSQQEPQILRKESMK